MVVTVMSRQAAIIPLTHNAISETISLGKTKRVLQMAEKLTFKAVLKWTEEECREFLEPLRWPNGPVCPKCGDPDPYVINRKSETKNKVKRLYRCKGCKRQFSSTVGTIFEGSKIPLSKWLAALFLMTSSKKGVSAHQLFRLLDIGSYKSAWFMAHRIREAMRDKGLLEPLSGDVEADETYMGGRTRRGHKVHHERIKDEIEMGLRPQPSRRPPYQDKPMGRLRCASHGLWRVSRNG